MHTKTNAPMHIVHITAKWTHRGVSGRETMAVELPVELERMIEVRQLQHSRVLRGACVDHAGRLEVRGNQKGQQPARDHVVRAARLLRFLAHTSLRPATAEETARTCKLLDVAPCQRTVAAVWMHDATGAWVAPITTPNADAARCKANGIAYLPPGWSNVWGANSTVPGLFCSDQATAAALTESLGVLHADGPLVWTGQSGTIERTDRTAPDAPAATHPGRSMPLERHVDVAQILAALCASRILQQAASSIRDVRRELAEWLRREHPSAECGAIYASRNKTATPIDGRAEQIQALEQVLQILEGGYRRSKRRDELTRCLRRARARLMLSSAPRELAVRKAA